MTETDIAIYTTLFLACVDYSLILERLHDWYTPRRTVWTVVLGNFLIWLALANIERYGTPLTAWTIIYGNIAGGAPIVAWQLWQNWKRTQEAQTG